MSTDTGTQLVAVSLDLAPTTHLDFGHKCCLQLLDILQGQKGLQLRHISLRPQLQAPHHFWPGDGWPSVTLISQLLIHPLPIDQRALTPCTHAVPSAVR